jgi:hypothetical protein
MKTDSFDHGTGDGNGIMFAPLCKADVDVKCFTSSNKKQCEHIVHTVKLDKVGDYVVFPSRCYHRGYNMITSNTINYTAQLFCRLSEKQEAWKNVTRRVNKNIIQGPVNGLRLKQLTHDICFNWDTAYSVNVFPPPKAFGSDKINATKTGIFYSGSSVPHP